MKRDIIMTATLPRDLEQTKYLSISSKRQITIPQSFYETFGFATKAECIATDEGLLIRPAENTDDFSEEILADLIKQGYSGQELLTKFKEQKQKVRIAVKKLIANADAYAKTAKPKSIDEIFGSEE